MELKSREREINESKIALSRLRQQLERTELEVQKEKDEKRKCTRTWSE